MHYRHEANVLVQKFFELVDINASVGVQRCKNNVVSLVQKVGCGVEHCGMFACAHDNTSVFRFFHAVNRHIVGFRAACGEYKIAVAVHDFQNIFARGVQSFRVFKCFAVQRRRVKELFNAVFFKRVNRDFVERRRRRIVKVNHFSCSV